MKPFALPERTRYFHVRKSVVRINNCLGKVPTVGRSCTTVLETLCAKANHQLASPYLLSDCTIPRLTVYSRRLLVVLPRVVASFAKVYRVLLAEFGFLPSSRTAPPCCRPCMAFSWHASYACVAADSFRTNAFLFFPEPPAPRSSLVQTDPNSPGHRRAVTRASPASPSEWWAQTPSSNPNGLWTCQINSALPPSPSPLETFSTQHLPRRAHCPLQ